MVKHIDSVQTIVSVLLKVTKHGSEMVIYSFQVVIDAGETLMIREGVIWVGYETNKTKKVRMSPKDRLSFCKQCCCVYELSDKPSKHEFGQTNKYLTWYIISIFKLESMNTMK